MVNNATTNRCNLGAIGFALWLLWSTNDLRRAKENDSWLCSVIYVVSRVHQNSLGKAHRLPCRQRAPDNGMTAACTAAVQMRSRQALYGEGDEILLAKLSAYAKRLATSMQARSRFHSTCSSESFARFSIRFQLHR